MLDIEMNTDSLNSLVGILKGNIESKSMSEYPEFSGSNYTPQPNNEYQFRINSIESELLSVKGCPISDVYRKIFLHLVDKQMVSPKELDTQINSLEGNSIESYQTLKNILTDLS